jgi:hypothetical protein
MSFVFDEFQESFQASELSGMAGMLMDKELVNVIEIGTKFTDVWNWMLTKSNGFCLSLSSDLKKVKEAQATCHRVNIVLDEPIAFLTKIQKTDMLKKLSLLLLNDRHRSNPVANDLADIGCLAAAWDFIPTGCMIAASERNVFIKNFFNEMQIWPLQDGPITVWIKP